MSPVLPRMVEESTAGLGHRLRTPLTHIIGYSALLIEAGEGSDSETAVRLETVNAQAEVILNRIEQWLSAGAQEGMANEGSATLRAAVGEPLNEIIRAVGALIQVAEGSALLDVLRIARACTELLAFVQQKGAAQPGLAARPAEGISPRSAEIRADEIHTNAASGARILAIDDNPGSLYILNRQLGKFGYSALSAESGSAGLEALQREPIDLVLLDVMMPEMNGVEVLQQIKKQTSLADIPVIMISALDEVESAAQCIELGAEDYLVKPFDPVLLGARIHSALERRRLQGEQRERTRQLQKATEDLQRANDDLQSFASVAAHDLQEPLRTITLTLQVVAMENGNELSEEQRGLLRLAVDGAGRMSRLITSLTAYSKSGSGEATLGNVDCEVALLEAITNLREAIKDSGAHITHGALPVVVAYPGSLVQLFQNLVVNAIRYRSEARPEIRIVAERTGLEWVISVSDNGMGIEEQFRRKIFQPFERLHGQDRPGTGLGLAICERILRRAGERIWVESQPGEGSTFRFTAHEAAHGKLEGQ